MVRNKKFIKFSIAFSNAWCAQVMVPPDAKRINVFKSGIPKGGISSYPPEEKLLLRRLVFQLIQDYLPLGRKLHQRKPKTMPQKHYQRQ